VGSRQQQVILQTARRPASGTTANAAMAHAQGQQLAQTRESRSGRTPDSARGDARSHPGCSGRSSRWPPER
jgi:predicted AAA+ superfamily ATPase